MNKTTRKGPKLAGLELAGRIGTPLKAQKLGSSYALQQGLRIDPWTGDRFLVQLEKRGTVEHAYVHRHDVAGRWISRKYLGAIGHTSSWDLVRPTTGSTELQLVLRMSVPKLGGTVCVVPWRGSDTIPSDYRSILRGPNSMVVDAAANTYVARHITAGRERYVLGRYSDLLGQATPPALPKTSAYSLEHGADQFQGDLLIGLDHYRATGHVNKGTVLEHRDLSAAVPKVERLDLAAQLKKIRGKHESYELEGVVETFDANAPLGVVVKLGSPGPDRVTEVWGLA